MAGRVTVVFDCETTGLAKNFKAPATDVDNWPRIVQLSWVRIADGNLETAEEHCYTVKPVGFEIPPASTAIHGVSQEHALEFGVSLESTLRQFAAAVGSAGEIAAHNFPFDSKVVEAECIRAGIRLSLPSRRICTMGESTAFCKLPPFRLGHFKWPKLVELHTILFGSEFENAHNALADTKASARCLFALRERGVIAAA